MAEATAPPGEAFRARPGPERSRRAPASVIALAVALGALAAWIGSPSDVDAADSDLDLEEQLDAGGAEGESVDAPAHLGLFAHRDPDGRLDVVLLAGVEAGWERGSIVLLPPPTLVEVPSLGEQTIAELDRFDPGLFEITVENALGVALDTVAVLDDSELVRGLAPAVGFEVELRRALQIEDERGTLSFNEGVQEITAAEAMRVLTAEIDDSELDRLVVEQSVIEGWRRALADEAVATATLEGDLRLVTIAWLAGADVRYASLPVERLSAAIGTELYGLDRDDVAAAMAEAFPWALLGPDGSRPRVELLNGTGAVGVTRQVAGVIVPAGGEVTLTGNVPGFGVDTTQVVYYREEDRADAEHLLAALGTGRLALANEPLGVIDVTVVIGADLPGTVPTDEGVAPSDDPVPDPTTGAADATSETSSPTEG